MSKSRADAERVLHGSVELLRGLRGAARERHEVLLVLGVPEHLPRRPGCGHAPPELLKTRAISGHKDCMSLCRVAHKFYPTYPGCEKQSNIFESALR